jgi:hypothetical protein
VWPAPSAFIRGCSSSAAAALLLLPLLLLPPCHSPDTKKGSWDVAEELLLCKWHSILGSHWGEAHDSSSSSSSSKQQQEQAATAASSGSSEVYVPTCMCHSCSRTGCRLRRQSVHCSMPSAIN